MVSPITQNYNVDIKIWSEVWNEKKYEMKKTYKSPTLYETSKFQI